MKRQICPHRSMLILLIVAFTVVSAFGCFAIVGRYIVSHDIFFAGDTFVKETRSNSFVLVLICSIVQIATMFSNKRWGKMIGIVASAVSWLLTAMYAPLSNASQQTMGGIISYHCEITWLGSIAIVLSFVILLFHIYLLKKQG